MSQIIQSLGDVDITSTRKDVRRIQASSLISFSLRVLIWVAYLFPNDTMECDRLDLQYQALKMLHEDQIYFAPLKDPKRILDIGTGTGIWPIEMGEACCSS